MSRLLCAYPGPGVWPAALDGGCGHCHPAGLAGLVAAAGDDPVWTGAGDDPWLPERLDAQAQFAASERSVYTDYWARLSGWLVAVTRAVLAGRRPDPQAVWSKAPAWAQSIANFAETTVRGVMGNAYRAIFGTGYRFDSRPAVAAHLATVRNRLAFTPDQVFDLIAAEIAEGAGAGESVDELSARVQLALDTTATPTWRNRAVVVARTETLGALNAGRVDAFEDVASELGGEFELLWLATDDERTRPTHRAADGQRVAQGAAFTVGGAALRFPGDPTGPPQEVIQCRCTTLLVRPGEQVDMSNRQYRDR